jgi:hypothetical protein
METMFGHDFGHVRLHTDDAAGRSATAIEAEAYTFGDQVVIGPQWQPHTDAVSRLLAHELTHVIQQRGQNAASPISIGDPGTDAEQEAAELAGSIGNGRVIDARAATAVREPVSKATLAPAIAQMALASGSQALDDRSRTDLGSLLGHDFSRVRIHHANAEAAEKFSVTAFSVGEHIIFGAGRCDTQPGRDLIAHELVHAADSQITADRAAVRLNGRSGSPTPAAVPAAAVEPDGAAAAAGRMHKSEFLDQLEVELMPAGDLELAPFGLSGPPGSVPPKVL